MKLLPDFPDESRVWLYATDRALTDKEMTELQKEIDFFVQKWAAHGDKLWAAGKVLNPYFVCFAVNDNLTPPSGCSIDASVHFLKVQEKQFGVDFFNRLKVVLYIDDDYKLEDFYKINSEFYTGKELVFDPMVGDLKRLRHLWPMPLNISSFSTFFES